MIEWMNETEFGKMQQKHLFGESSSKHMDMLAYFPPVFVEFFSLCQIGQKFHFNKIFNLRSLISKIGKNLQMRKCHIYSLWPLALYLK